MGQKITAKQLRPTRRIKSVCGNALQITCFRLASTRFQKLLWRTIITPDGEILEGEALKEVVVIGKVTLEVKALNEDYWPGI